MATNHRLGLAGTTRRPGLERPPAFLQEELAAVDPLLGPPIARDADRRGKAARRRELQGDGPVLSATLLADVPELGQIDSAPRSALSGGAPFARDSGKTSRKRPVRGGGRAVRNVRSIAAVSALRCHAVLAAFYARRRAAGKPATVCLVAVRRTMLGVLNRLVADPHFILVR